VGAFQGDVLSMNSTMCNTDIEGATISNAEDPLPGIANRRLTRLRRRAERGATAVEYALMVGLIAVGIITAVASLRDKTSSTFNTVNSAMGTPASAATTTNLTGWTFGANYGAGSVPLPGSGIQYRVKYVNSAGADEITSPFPFTSPSGMPCLSPSFTVGSISVGGKCYYQLW
jgi:pilus assembly protein Flp/PilA